MVGKPNAYERFLAQQLADPEFRAEFERERREIETIDAMANALDADIKIARRSADRARRTAV